MKNAMVKKKFKPTLFSCPACDSGNENKYNPFACQMEDKLRWCIQCKKAGGCLVRPNELVMVSTECFCEEHQDLKKRLDH